MTKKTKYECPTCKTQITVNIKLTHPPTCSKHIGGGKVMREVG